MVQEVQAEAHKCFFKPLPELCMLSPWATPSSMIEFRIEGWRKMPLDVKSCKVMRQGVWILGGMKNGVHSYN